MFKKQSVKLHCMSNLKTRDLKPHIGIFGRRNVGKSSLINTLTGQETAIVSDIAGTTTDPVKRTVEIIGFAPVIIIDTAGFDDEGNLGTQRIEKTKQVIQQIDLALLLISNNSFALPEEELLKSIRQFEIPIIIIFNKTDILPPDPVLINSLKKRLNCDIITFSNTKPDNLQLLIENIKKNIPETTYTPQSILGNIVEENDIVMLVTPIDTEAPAGRLILPQVQILRDLLDNHSIAITVQPQNINKAIQSLNTKPKLIITDSQLLNKADEIFPKEIPITGFSIVLAHYKGNFEAYLKGTPQIDNLKNGDRLLILESCSHHTSCEDIGRHKIPQWLRQYTRKELSFDFVSGLSQINTKINNYALVIQCGGCMVTRKQLHSRLKSAIDANVPITNYGLAIAYMHGYYKRVVAPFQKLNT